MCGLASGFCFLHGLSLTDQVENNFADSGYSGQEIGVSALGSVLVKSHIQHPVQPVFNHPVSAEHARQRGSNVALVEMQARNEVAHFIRVFLRCVCEFAFDSGHDDAPVFQSGPFIQNILGKFFHERGRQHAAFPCFSAAVPQLNTGTFFCSAPALFGFKPTANLAVKFFVVAFDGKAVVAVFFVKKKLRQLFLRIHRIAGEDRTAEIHGRHDVDGLSDLVLFFLDKYLLKAHFIVSIEKVQHIAAVSLVLQALCCAYGLTVQGNNPRLVLGQQRDRVLLNELVDVTFAKDSDDIADRIVRNILIREIGKPCLKYRTMQFPVLSNLPAGKEAAKPGQDDNQQKASAPRR